MAALGYPGTQISLKEDAVPMLFPVVEAMLMPSVRRKQAVTRASTTTPLGSKASGPRKRATGARIPVSRNRSKLLTCILALAARLRGPLAIEPSDVVIEARVDGCVPRSKYINYLLMECVTLPMIFQLCIPLNCA